MTEKKEAGLWDLIKELAKEAPGITKELTTDLWALSKEVGKEAPGLIKAVAKETREAVKSYSENSKVDAQKHRLKHIENMKKFRKRAKDAGISEEDLAKLKKDYGFTQRESEVSASALDSIRITAARGLDLEFEKRFEQHLESIEKAQEMARNRKPKK